LAASSFGIDAAFSFLLAVEGLMKKSTRSYGKRLLAGEPSSTFRRARSSWWNPRGFFSNAVSEFFPFFRSIPGLNGPWDAPAFCLHFSTGAGTVLPSLSFCLENLIAEIVKSTSKPDHRRGKIQRHAEGK